MRTYNQAVSRIANGAVNDEMNGGTGQLQDVYMVAFIYGKSDSRVTIDVRKMMVTIKNEIIKQFELKYTNVH